jgi:hypothetical protein
VNQRKKTNGRSPFFIASLTGARTLRTIQAVMRMAQTDMLFDDPNTETPLNDLDEEFSEDALDALELPSDELLEEGYEDEEE